MQGYRDARGQQPGESGNRSQLSGEGKRNNDAEHEPHDNLAEEEELVSAARIMDVAEYGLAPQFAEPKCNRENDAQNCDSDKQTAQLRAVLAFDIALPVGQVGLVEPQQNSCFAQGKNRGSGLPELSSKSVEIFFHACERTAVARIGLLGQFIALLGKLFELVDQRRAEFFGTLRQRFGLIDPLIDAVDFARKTK